MFIRIFKLRRANHFRWRWRFGFGLLLACVVQSETARAGTTWDGGGGNNLWSTANNWNPNGVPANNGTSSLAFAGSTRLTPDMDSNWNINSLTFNSGAGAFTLGSTGGFTLTIEGGGITNSNSNTETINNAVTLGAAQTWSATSGDLNFGGNIANGGFLLTISGGSNTTASGVVSGSGGLTKNGAGTLTLSGTNTYSGGTTFNAGTVSISSDANLGASSGSLTFGGGTLAATQSAVMSRAIGLTGAATFSVGIGLTLEDTGAVSGNGNLTLTGNGILILSGSGSNGTGSTTLNGGVLSLRGTVSLGTGNLAFTGTGGILGLGNGDFTRALGTGAGQVNMNSASGGAGFGAWGADRVVNLGGAGAGVTWGVGDFLAGGQPLYFGTPTANHVVDFQNPINLNSAVRTITVTGGVGSGADAQISGVISGTGSSGWVMNSVFGLTGWNPGSLILTNGNNSYAGSTTINAGTLLLGANATATAGNTVLGSGSSDVLFGNTSGALNAGMLTDGAFTISRNIRAQSGNTGTSTLGGNTANASTFSGNIFLGTASAAGKGVTLTAVSGGTATFSGVVQDATSASSFGLLTKAGAGTVVLSGVNTYSGGTAINAGTLSINQSANLGALTGGLTINAGTLEVSGTFSTSRAITLGNAATTFQIDPSQTYTITSVVGGSGTLNKAGTGTMVLSGVNTYTGGSIINAGTVNVNSSSSLGAIGGGLTINAGTLEISTGFGTARAITLGDAASTFQVDPSQTYTVTTAIAGAGALNKTGSGTMVVTAANTYSGGNVVGAGILQLSGSGTLGSTSAALAVNGGTLDLNGTNQNVGALSGSGGTILNNSTGTAKTLTVGTGGGTGSYAGVIADHTSGTGTLALTKTGGGSETLTGANTYTGATVVNAGSLFVNGSTASGSAVAVNSSGSTLGGSGTINGTISIASSGANLSPGASGVGSTAILHTGALTLATGSNFNVDLNTTTAGTGYDQLGVTGTVSLGGLLASNLLVTAGPSLAVGQKFFVLLNDSTDAITGTFAQGTSITAGNNGDIFTINYADNGDGGSLGNDISLTVTAVPEPRTFLPGILGFVAIASGLVRRTRRSL